MTLIAPVFLSILAFLVLTQTTMAQGNLVINGGFDTDASGWVVTNVYVSGGGGYQSSLGNPPGSVVLYNLLYGSSHPSPTASQEISGLTSGALYIVSGDYRRIAGKNVTDISFGVALDSIYLFETVVPTNSNWYGFSFDYTATSTSAILSLSAQINGTDYSYAIDNISMQAVPEPSTLALSALGGLLLAYRRLALPRFGGQRWG